MVSVASCGAMVSTCSAGDSSKARTKRSAAPRSISPQLRISDTASSSSFLSTTYTSHVLDGDLSHRISRHEDRQLAFLTQQKAKDPLPQGDVPTSDNATAP